MILRKLDIKVGFTCNSLCRHCVQGDKRYNEKDKPSEQIKAEIKEARSRGIKDIVFTGGEPTIRDELASWVSLAKDLDYHLIQVQTNGRRFASKTFTKKMLDAGVNEFAPALNGHVPELHDFLLRSPGAFKQTVQGIKNVRNLSDIPILTNTVVTKPNYRYLNQITSLLVKLKVNQYQLAFVHPAGRSWTNFDSIVPYVSLAAPHIHKGLQVGIDNGLKVMAEAMPYCHMSGYEIYVSELQIPPSDVYESGVKVREWEKWRINEGKWKGDTCKPCAFYNVCEGPWIEYVKKRGSSEFKPISGTKVTFDDLNSQRN
ncbi:MAG: radical SAM protein [Candidatus Altiarchaeota archaeon]|nr:radical SAM protein [Candidatus Altiarchaeota archaeon]